MPEQIPTEHVQPVEGARDREDGESNERSQRRADDFERAGEHKDIWTAGQEADANAGDEGIDDARREERMDDVDIEASREASGSESESGNERERQAMDQGTQGELKSDDIDVELPESARRMDINDKTR